MASDATADDVLVVHTAQLVLSHQNFMAFREYLAALWSRGEREQFWAFWVVCPLVEHLPAPSVPISDITIGDGALPVRRVVCTQDGCAPCESGRGGYQFPFWGRGRGGLCLSRQAWDPRRLVSVTSATIRSSTPRDGVQRRLASTWRTCSRASGAGSCIRLSITASWTAMALPCLRCLVHGTPGLPCPRETRRPGKECSGPCPAVLADVARLGCQPPKQPRAGCLHQVWQYYCHVCEVQRVWWRDAIRIDPGAALEDRAGEL